MLYRLKKEKKVYLYESLKKKTNKKKPAVAFMAQQLTNPTRIHEDVGLIPGRSVGG